VSEFATVFRGMSQSELDAAYDNRRAFPDFAERAVVWAQRSRAVYANAVSERELAYGDEPRQRIDFIHCGVRSRPTFAFIHGGYWQWNDKADHAFVGEGLLELGVNLALIEYSLAPVVRVGDIVRETSAAIAWLQARLTTRFDAAETLVIGGHSAGGHLAAMGAEVPGVDGALLVSGIYDLAPIRASYLNAALDLDAAEVDELSPIRRPPSVVPVCVAVGDRELSELVRQSTDYAAYLTARVSNSTLCVVSAADHFIVLETVASRTGALCGAACRLLGIESGGSLSSMESNQ